MAQSNDSTPQLDTTPKMISSASGDIAETQCGDRMRVRERGRMTYQKIFVRPSNTKGGKTTLMYNPEVDLPIDLTVSILPTREERESQEGTISMLVVGLVIASEPLKYSTSGSLRSKQKAVQRKERGILSRPDKVLRALVPATERIVDHIKYYVAVNLNHGLCDLRLISAEAVFFFPEYFTSDTKQLSLRPRKTALSDACKYAAATIKEKSISPTTAGGAEPTSHESAASEATVPTPMDRVTTHLTQQESNLRASREVDVVNSTTTFIEGSTLSSTLATLAESDSVQTFLSQTNDRFTFADARSVLRALQTAYPFFPPIEPTTIARVRETLQKQQLLAQLTPMTMLPVYLDMLEQFVNAGSPEAIFDMFVPMLIPLAKRAVKY